MRISDWSSDVCSSDLPSMRMSMPMVQVGIMGVPMHQRRMPVPMAMRLAVRDTGRVFMLVVVVMNVAMGMLQRLVCVLVGVRFGKMQPAHGIGRSSCGERGCRYVMHSVVAVSLKKK